MVTTGADALVYYAADEVAQMTGMQPLAVRAFFLLNGFGESVRADRLLEVAGVIAAGNERVRELREALELNRYSQVLLFSTEGNTDPDKYRDVVCDGEYATK